MIERTHIALKGGTKTKLCNVADKSIGFVAYSDFAFSSVWAWVHRVTLDPLIERIMGSTQVTFTMENNTIYIEVSADRPDASFVAYRIA